MTVYNIHSKQLAIVLLCVSFLCIVSNLFVSIMKIISVTISRGILPTEDYTSNWDACTLLPCKTHTCISYS